MIMRQVWLRVGGQDAEPPYTEMVTWLPADPRIRPDTVLSLKGDDTRWTVLQLYDQREQAEINQFWHVGGL